MHREPPSLPSLPRTFPSQLVPLFSVLCCRCISPVPLALPLVHHSCFNLQVLVSCPHRRHSEQHQKRHDCRPQVLQEGKPTYNHKQHKRQDTQTVQTVVACIIVRSRMPWLLLPWLREATHALRGASFCLCLCVVQPQCWVLPGSAPDERDEPAATLRSTVRAPGSLRCAGELPACPAPGLPRVAFSSSNVMERRLQAGK